MSALKKAKLKAVLLPILLQGCLLAQALDLTKINLAYQYDVFDSFDCRYRVSQADDQIHIYYTLESDSVLDYQQVFLIQNGYESKSHDTLASYSIDTIAFTPKKVFYRLSISPPDKNLLLITLANLNKGIYLVYDVQVASASGFPGFTPTTPAGRPILRNYVTSDEISISGADEQYHVYRYQDDFGPADPAMGRMKQIAPSLDIDSSYFFTNELSGLEPYYFYLIQSDTLADHAITLLKCPSYYPEFRRLEELIGPLTYITTPSEIKALRNQMSRQAFENFWINTYGTKFRAKNAIRVYYDKVEQANTLFTDYKQGWKTDRGLLYIIFGQPDEVIRSDRTEIWRYNSGIEFEFIRISTLFTPSLYSLKRDKKYEELWYDQVGSIRKGL